MNDYHFIEKIKRSKQFLSLLFILCLGMLVALPTQAQINLASQQNLANVKVDNLTDAQLLTFKRQFQNQGYTADEIEPELLRRKMPSSEVEKFLERLSTLDKAAPTTIEPNSTESRSANTTSTDNPRDKVSPRVFGSEIFNNPKLSFEPNLKMATPLNYQLGPDDELLIDIFGYSEQSFKLLVSPEGHIRIPNLGPVQVAGLTVEQAQQKIKNQLTALYPRIGSGETSVSVNLGKIRSIKVIILGEVVLPGTYSLPSLASVFNGLYASGGPNKNGSFRKIKVIRANKVIAQIDMYEFLLNGTSKGNIGLKDQDVIKVEPFETMVELKGLVRREGFFEVLPKEDLQRVLNFAGGFSPNAYTNRIKVIRNTGVQKSVADIEKAMYPSFFPKNGDVFTIDSVLDRFDNRVELEGAVFRPGYFSVETNPTLKKLIENADGLKEDAFMSRATILRKKSDNTLEVLSVDLTSILDGSKELKLQREDKISIASKLEMRENYTLNINGSVLKPGVFPFAENMHIEDLIILAGGLKESASLKNILVSQRLFDVDKSNPNAEISKVSSFSINKELKDDPNSNYVLKPFDIVTIYSIPGYQEQMQVMVNGEVMFPGNYVLSKGDERISDVIKRAGGLTANGFPGGAILIRKKGSTYQDLIVKENKLQALKKLSKDTLKIAQEIESEMSKSSDIVGIDLERILKKPGSKEDLFLRKGDILEIPFLKQTVLVSGQVLYPVRLRYEGGSSFRNYVSHAGGFSSKALKKRSYIVYANGTAKDTKNFLFFKVYPKVKPGSEIVIPIRDDKKSLSTLEVVTILTSLTSMVVILSSVIK